MTKSDGERDGRSATARGYVLANRVLSICMQMAVPPLLGWWADSKFNTKPWFVIIGSVLGFAISMLQLAHLAKDSGDSK